MQYCMYFLVSLAAVPCIHYGTLLLLPTTPIIAHHQIRRSRSTNSPTSCRKFRYILPCICLFVTVEPLSKVIPDSFCTLDSLRTILFCTIGSGFPLTVRLYAWCCYDLKIVSHVVDMLLGPINSIGLLPSTLPPCHVPFASSSFSFSSLHFSLF